MVQDSILAQRAAVQHPQGNNSRKLLFDNCSSNTNFLISWAYLKFIVCIHFCYQVALHPHFEHTLHILKLMPIFKCFLQVVCGNYKIYTEESSEHWLLKYQKEYVEERVSQVSKMLLLYIDRKTEPNSSLSSPLLHNTQLRSAIYYGFR